MVAVEAQILRVEVIDDDMDLLPAARVTERLYQSLLATV